MSELLKLTLALLGSGVSRQGGKTAERVAHATIAAGAVALCLVGALACALTALWIYLLPHIGPVGAPLIVSSVLLLIAAGVLMRKPRPPAPRAPEIAPEALLREASRLLKAYKVEALIAALLAGLVAGSREK